MSDPLKSAPKPPNGLAVVAAIIIGLLAVAYIFMSASLSWFAHDGGGFVGGATGDVSPEYVPIPEDSWWTTILGFGLYGLLPGLAVLAICVLVVHNHNVATAPHSHPAPDSATPSSAAETQDGPPDAG